MAEAAPVNLSVDLPWAVGVAVGVAVAVALTVILSARQHRARLAQLGTPELLARLVPNTPSTTSTWRAVRLAAAVLLGGIAFAGPRWGTPAGGVEVQGIDLVVAVDASLSMLAEDESPSRLARARQEIQRLRATSRGDRMGLIAFAGRSYILTPLTTDDGALALFLDNLDPSIVGQPGSSLAAALTQGVDLLGPATSGDRALVILTDGETFDESEAVLEAARRVRAANVSLVLVGFGTSQGAMIPVREDGRVTNHRDADGIEVVTRYDGAQLSAVAQEAGGVLIASDASDKATRIRAALAGLRATKRRVDARQSVPLRFQWFLLPAVILFALDLALGSRRRLVTAAALLCTFMAADASAQAVRDLQRAEAEFRASRPLSAARAWRSALEAGDRSPQTLYNLGTAFLAADSLDTAVEVLERTAVAPSETVRAQAWYNLGLAYLRRGLAAQGEQGTASLRGAARAYRQVLLAAPADSAARFNYELAVRALQQRNAPSAGGGGRGGGRDRTGQGNDPSLERAQAEQLLDAAARDERDTRSRQQPGRPTPPTRGRDW
jgi:Ca-activated chloride channel family protein